MLMHSLAGTFVKELPEEKIEESNNVTSLWPVKIIFMPTKSRTLYFKYQAEQKSWFSRIWDAIGHKNIHEFYTLEHTIGKGQFGQVRLAKHRKTGLSYAIKIMAKIDMKVVEAQQTRREIEVMKMGKHPNIVRLVDLFEDSDNFFLVLELMAGGDLFDYLKGRGFRLTEERTREIVLQITLSV